MHAESRLILKYNSDQWDISITAEMWHTQTSTKGLSLQCTCALYFITPHCRLVPTRSKCMQTYCLYYNPSLNKWSPFAVQYNLVKWQLSKGETIVREKPAGEQDGRLHANLPVQERNYCERENFEGTLLVSLNRVYCRCANDVYHYTMAISICTVVCEVAICAFNL